MAKVTLKGSERTSMPGTQTLAPADPTERFEVSVIVRRHARQALKARVSKLETAHRSIGFLSRADFSKKHGADAADFAAVRQFADAHGLTVVQEHAARRTVVLSGTVQQFSAAFEVQLHQMTDALGTYRGRDPPGGATAARGFSASQAPGINPRESVMSACAIGAAETGTP